MKPPGKATAKGDGERVPKEVLAIVEVVVETAAEVIEEVVETTTSTGQEVVETTAAAGAGTLHQLGVLGATAVREAGNVVQTVVDQARQGAETVVDNTMDIVNAMVTIAVNVMIYALASELAEAERYTEGLKARLASLEVNIARLMREIERLRQLEAEEEERARQGNKSGARRRRNPLATNSPRALPPSAKWVG